MVSTINLVVLAGCAILCLGAMLCPCYFIKQKSSKLETGLLGALCYGVLGYIWQYLIGAFVKVAIAMLPFFAGGNNLVLARLAVTVVDTAFAALALHWGIFLTNQKQRSLYRSAAVGIGFSIGRNGLMVIYQNLYWLYYGVQINRGAIGTSEKEMALKSYLIGDLSAGQTILGTYEAVMMFVIVFALAYLMGHFYLEKKPKLAWYSVLVIYEILLLLLEVPGLILDGHNLILHGVISLVLTVFAAAGGTLLYHWLRTGEVVVDPRQIWGRFGGHGGNLQNHGGNLQNHGGNLQNRGGNLQNHGGGGK